MIALSEIQGNILRGYTFPHARFLLIEFKSQSSARSWLRRNSQQVTSAEIWQSSRPESTFNLAFSPSGLSMLGCDAATLNSFSEPFREGMATRASQLGDTGPNSPMNWEEGLGSDELSSRTHALVSIYANTVSEIETKMAASQLDDSQEVNVLFVQNGEVLPGRREHFGFRDGISQPRVTDLQDGLEATDHRHFSATRNSPAIALGEFLVGVPGENGITYQSPKPPFDTGGTYMVFRKIRQDVSAFRQYLNVKAEQLRLDPEWLAARMVGRWKDGTPVSLSSDAPDVSISSDPTQIDNFDFTDDPTGIGCPIGSHIRRCNPRGGLAGGPNAVSGHRLLRRGIPYGPPLPEGDADDRKDRGLLFISFGSNLREQFEFVQRLWVNEGAFTGSLDPAEKDPLVGNNGGLGTMTLPMPGFPRKLFSLPDFVSLRYGAYFFVPSIRAIESLAS